MNVPVELIVVPTAEELRHEAFVLWSGPAHRSVARTLALLARQYAGVAVELPTESAVRNWVRRHDWRARADADLQESYPRQLREFALGQWRLLQAMQQRVLDAVSGAGPALTKEETRVYEVLLKGSGWAAFGFNSGGEARLQFDAEAGATREMSVEERLRVLRAGFVEQNTGNAG